jgi:hypothetical protein
MTYNTAQLSEEALSLLLRLLYSSGYTEVDEDQGEYYCSYTYSNGSNNVNVSFSRQNGVRVVNASLYTGIDEEE